MPKKNGKRKKQVKEDFLKASNPSLVTSRKAKKKKLNNTADHQKIQTSQIKANNEENSISLPSLLKRHRGIAATTPLPPEWSGIEKFTKASVPKFLTPRDGEDFDSCRKECYRGFHWEEPERLPPSFHESFKHALHSLNSSGLFLYDIVQPGGKRLSQTFVTRTLIGAPGSTYKYLGLRLFSHPWCEVDSRGDGHVGSSNKNASTGKRLSLVNDLGYSKQCAKALIEIGQINQDLIQRTKKALQNEIVPHVDKELVGSAEYSLTLINRMEPSSVKKDLKMDKVHGMGKTSVSWHKDSGLQDFSSIAVYHTMEQYGESFQGIGSDQQEQWKVALRVADSNSQTPALSVPLPSGALYYLLDDLNHQHEHAVVAGSESLRYSSTHRVAREGCGTWQYIRDKCEKVLSSPLCSEALSDYEKIDDFIKSFNNTSKRKQLEKAVRSCESLMTELEFEWIRQ
jgi:alpha-ketoglutarate-dependent dioxygenase FTO